MSPGVFCISIDVELAWGIRHRAGPALLRLVLDHDRAITRRLLGLFEHFEIPVTWAVVGQLLVEERDTRLAPGPDALWHAPELIEEIRMARPGHEIASHSFTHADFTAIDEAAAALELDSAVRAHAARGLDVRTFVYPWNRIAHTGLLAGRGVRIYRGADAGLPRVAARAGRVVHRAVNLVDKMLPVPPSVVAPADNGSSLVELPGSMLLISRAGLRRAVRPALVAAKSRMGLRRAAATGRCFHLWFHPSNFYHQAEAQFAILTGILREAASLRDAYRLDVRTLGSFADRSRGARGA